MAAPTGAGHVQVRTVVRVMPADEYGETPSSWPAGHATAAAVVLDAGATHAGAHAYDGDATPGTRGPRGPMGVAHVCAQGVDCGALGAYCAGPAVAMIWPVGHAKTDASAPLAGAQRAVQERSGVQGVGGVQDTLPDASQYGSRVAVCGQDDAQGATGNTVPGAQFAVCVNTDCGGRAAVEHTTTEAGGGGK